MLLQYDIRVVGAQTVDRAMAGIEQRLARHNAYVRRTFGTPARGGARGAVTATGTGAVAGAAGAAAREEQRAALMRQRAIDQQLRGEQQIERQRQQQARGRQQDVGNRMRSEQALARQKAREEATSARNEARARRERQQAINRQSRSQQSLARQRLREERMVERSVKQTASRRASMLGAGGRRAMGVVGSVGRVGMAMTGIAGAALGASAVMQAGQLDEISRRLAIQGRAKGDRGANPDQLRQRFTQVGIARSIDPVEVAKGAAAFVALTGNLKDAISNVDMFAQVAQAAGANVTDLAGVGAMLTDVMDVKSVDDMRQAFALLVQQGKLGSFELKSMAEDLPQVAGTAARAGVKGVRGLRQLGGLMQVGMSEIRSAPETSTAVMAMFRQLTAKATKMQSGEAFGGTKVKVFEGGDPTKPMRNFVDVLSDSLAASKGNLIQLQEVFDVRGIKAISPLITAYRDAADEVRKSKGTKKEQETAGRAAIASKLGRFDVQGDYNMIIKDAKDAQKSFNVHMTQVSTQLKDVISSAVFPELVKLAPAMHDLVPAVRTGTRMLVELVRFLGTHPFAGLGALFAASVAIEVGKARLAALLTALLVKAFSRVGGGGGAGVGGGGGAGSGAGGGRARRFFGRPTVGGMGRAAGQGVLLGAGVAAGIYAGGAVDFQQGESEMVQSGQDFNRVRNAGVNETDQLQEEIDKKRRRVAELKQPGFLQDMYEGVFHGIAKLTGGDTATSREVQLGTEQQMLGELEKRLSALEEFKEIAKSIKANTKSQEEANKALERAAKRLGLTDLNRGTTPSDVKT